MDTKFKVKDYTGLIINSITLLEKTDKKKRIRARINLALFL